MKCCVGFTPDVTGHTTSIKFNFCLISPQNICPKVLGGNQDMFWQMWDDPLCSLGSAVAFSFEFSHGCRFCPVSFFLLNDELWLYFSAVLYMLLWVLLWPGALGVILVGRPLLGRFTTVPSFPYLWIMALTVVRWSCKALDIALLPFPNWYMSTILSVLEFL